MTMKELKEQNQALSAKITELHDELSKAHDEASYLKKQIENMEENKSFLKDEMKKLEIVLESERKDKKHWIDLACKRLLKKEELGEKLDAEINKNVELKYQNDTLEVDLCTLRDHYDELLQKNSELAKEVEKRAEINRASAEKNNKVITENNTLKVHNDELMKKNEDLKTRISELNTEISKEQERISLLKNEIESRDQYEIGLRKEKHYWFELACDRLKDKEELREKLDAAVKENTELLKKNEEANQKCTELMNSLSQTKEAFNGAQHELDILTSDVAKVRRHNSELIKQNESLKDVLANRKKYEDDDREELAMEVEKVNETISVVKDKNAELMKEVEKKSEINREIMKKNNYLIDKNNDLEEQLKDVESRYATLYEMQRDGENKLLRKINDQYVERHETDSKKNDRLIEDRGELLYKISKLEEKHFDECRQISEYEEENKDLKKFNNQLLEERDDLLNENADVKIRLAQSKEENKELKRHADDLYSRLHKEISLEQELKVARQANEALKDRVLKYIKAEATLKKMISEYEEENRKLKDNRYMELLKYANESRLKDQHSENDLLKEKIKALKEKINAIYGVQRQTEKLIEGVLNREEITDSNEERMGSLD